MREGIIALILLSTFGVGYAQQSLQTPDLDQARLDQLRTKGYEALYNLDYEEARRDFQEIVRQFPDHPAGPQCLAGLLWLQELNRSRHLQASLYNTDSFYSGTELKPDPRVVDQFRQWTRSAEVLAEARLKKNPHDVESLYFLGATEGLKAMFSAAVERRFSGALRDSDESVDRHREVLKLDPTFHDAELTIGMYNYIVGSLPLPLKLLAGIGGIRGSKKRGLETLERVAKDGHWARDIARLLLIDLYKREKRWTDAIAMAQDLAERYPRNYLFRLQAADALISEASSLRNMKSNNDAEASVAEREAFQIFTTLLRDGTNHAAADLIHFRYGEALLTTGNAARAAEEFEIAARVSDGEPTLETLAHLRAAQAFDLAGKKREAQVEYRVVLQRPNVHHSQEEAKRGLGSLKK